MFELIMNILLVVFLGYSYFTHVLEAPVPVKVQKNPYAFQPDTWPKVIIVLLLIDEGGCGNGCTTTYPVNNGCGCGCGC